MGIHLITMPDIGEGITEVEVIEWIIKVGDSVGEDDLLCVVMTEKVTVEIPSPVEGQITWLGAEAGDVMAVGADLLRLQVKGDGNTNDEPRELGTNTADPAHKTTISASEPPPTPVKRKPLTSPAIRQRAREKGIDLQSVSGTGPRNRITREDLAKYIDDRNSPKPQTRNNPGPDTSIKEIKIIGLRRKIAETMQDTMQRIPHFTYVEEIDVTELEALRSHLNKNRREDQSKLTLLPFLIKALVKTMKAYPQMFARFDDEAGVLYQYASAHIGIATQTANGLVVPVVKHAETLDIWHAATEVMRLATATRNGKAGREELSGSNITITSLGTLGGITTTPVINSPEVAIIGVNKIAKRPFLQNGIFVPRDMMNLSSSFDHRIIDGWDAANFIHHIKDIIESPATLFLDD